MNLKNSAGIELSKDTSLAANHFSSYEENYSKGHLERCKTHYGIFKDREEFSITVPQKSCR